MIRPAGGGTPLWVTGDNEIVNPRMIYTANGGSLVSSSWSQDPHVIDKGIGLAPDTITPEHGWIVAIVPTGAVSADVQVVLEDD